MTSVNPPHSTGVRTHGPSLSRCWGAGEGTHRKQAAHSGVSLREWGIHPGQTKPRRTRTDTLMQALKGRKG
jgi:hypothetical protein